jgi:hypothetical protein
MRKAGESCVAANRFLVHRDIAEDFAQRLASRFAALVPGDPFDPHSTIGPLIDQRQSTKVADLVDDALSAGARVLLGGKPIPGDGHFFEPTVLTDVPHPARIRHEEIFGPVAAVYPFDTEQDALQRAGVGRVWISVQHSKMDASDGATSRSPTRINIASGAAPALTMNSSSTPTTGWRPGLRWPTARSATRVWKAHCPIGTGRSTRSSLE